MHALHRPHLPRAITATVIVAVVAIVLTLALAAGLNDLMTRAASAGAGSASQTFPAPTTAAKWSNGPFGPLLSTPVPPPWASTRREPPALVPLPPRRT